ncbi:unnamed protein product [Strongylus vulgaris]|uniref:Uncharacterized protein n=1 Tax=Strongylus vulgaris TaxID=40348 RepID=A0A3P7KQY5_STRVU|nr:unnamed protein product [Strongylus vulgaris]
MTAQDGEGQTPEVNLLWKHNRQLLFDCLDALEGEKTIIWDRSLMQRVNLFAGPSILKLHGVVSNFALDQFRPFDTPHVVFFLAPTLAAVDLLCEYIDKAKTDTVILVQ